VNLETSGANPYTAGIARFVAGLRYEDIPQEVKDRIKLLMLDSLGCALFGAELEWSRILMSTLKTLDSSSGCGVWGTGIAYDPIGDALFIADGRNNRFTRH